MNFKILPIVAVFLFSLVSVGQALEIDFTTDNGASLFGESAKNVPEVTDGQMILPEQIETKLIPIEAGKKYKLQIVARVDDDFVVEENDRAHIHTLKSFRYRSTSTYGIAFLDAEGNAVKFHGSVSGFFLSKTLQPYTFVFYAPAGAAALTVDFRSNQRKTFLSSLRLVEETEEKTVNPNPDFRYGELSYSGWQPNREGRLYTRPDGKTVLHVGYGGSSPYFPLNPAKKYRLTAIGEGGNMTLRYVNEEGKTLVSRPLGSITPEGKSIEVTPPKGTVAGRVTMLGSLILEEFKVVELD